VNSSLRRLTSVVVVGVALGVPGVASAHGGGNYTGFATATAPTVDGVLGAAEWAPATASYSVTFGSIGTATVRFMRTANDLYVGVVVTDALAGPLPNFSIFFDDNHDGLKDIGEDAWLAFPGFGQDYFWNDPPPAGGGDASHYDDTTVGGSSDAFAGGTRSGSDVIFELRHPLCTTDVAHDICLSTGPVGVNFMYQRDGSTFAWAPGADSASPGDWADLTLQAAPGDTTPPTVTVTAPTAGTLVSGTVTAAATATDNVGVTAVDFRYFDGASFFELGTATGPGPTYTATFDSTQFADRAVGSATLYAVAHDAAGNTTGAGNSIGIDNTSPGTLTGATISITGDTSAVAGAASTLIANIDVNAIRGAQGDGPSSTPLAGIPLAGIPLAGIPLAGIPLAGIPLAGIGFTSTNLNQNGLGGVPLSSIPLHAPDSWQARLDANATFKGTPVQSVTLGQVLDTTVVTSPSQVSLDDLDLASSPLAGIPLAGIALGGLPLAGIPLAGIGSTPNQNLAAWCDYINTQPGYTCSTPSSLSSQTVIGISLQGVPLAGIPLAGIPLAGIDLTSSPLAGIPLAGIDLTSSPLAGIPLAGINFASSPLAGIPLAGISAGVVDCASNFDCTGKTLGQAFTAGKIDPNATVGDIGYYCTAGSEAATLPCTGTDKAILLKDFVLNGLPPDVTLYDLLASILLKAAYDWESLPLPEFPIQDFRESGGTISYDVPFSLTGSRGGSFPAEIAVKIPADARYVPGSSYLSSVEGNISDPTLTSDGKLHWFLKNIGLNAPDTLSFDVRSPLELGTASATAEITPGSLPAVQAPAAASTRILQTFDCPPGTEFCNTPQAGPDTLYLGYTANGDDRDFFQLQLPEGTEPGAKVTVHLSHLEVDDDLVVYGPVPEPLRAPKPSTSVLQAVDVPPDLQQRTQAVIPEVLGDVPVDDGPEGTGVLGVSDNRGLADEEVTFIVPENAGGSLYIQITSFDGAYSNEPWMLRVEESPAIDLPAGCKQPLALGGGTTKTMPTTVGGNTLYLFNSKRYGDLYGSVNEDAVWNKLQTLAARTDAAGGTVIPIDDVPGVASTLGPWVADPCSPGKNNGVVRAVGAYLDTITAAYKYIVIVGDWTVLPAGLVLDNTLYANERDYASTFFGAENTQYLSSYALGYLPTDDPYGDTSYSGQGTYIPEVAVGRLVEKHEDIMGQLQQYLDRNGAIDPATALVTGYDFLSDGASAISNGLKANVSAPTELINEVWSKSDLLAAMFPASNPPTIDSVNAHYDHHQALPADQNTAGIQTNLFTTANLQSTSGRLVITIGCHSGTPVSDLLVAAGLAPDWDQSYSANGAIGYIAQSTFGLGETAGVAYSEKLHALLAERLDGSLTVGQALVYAKQEYSSMPLTGAYDTKVIDGSGLYGLPMYRVGTGAVTPPPSPLPLGTDAATGLQAATFNLSPSFTLVTASTGRFYTNAGNASFQNRRPIEPFTKLDVTQPGLIAHGALVTAAVSSDQANFNAAFSRPVEDRAAFSPELVGDATSPTRLQSIATFSTPTGLQQRLVISTGQFLADGVPDALGIGTQRLFSSLGGVVLYASDSETDFRAPTFGPVQAFASSPSTIGFAVDVNDGDAAPAAAVKRVVALYKDASGAWRSIDLNHEDTSRRWSGGGTFAGSAAEWFIQAVDGAGNVGVISNKAHIDPVAPPAAIGGISASVSGPLYQTSGWYTGDATVTISGAPGITFSIDGSDFDAYTAPIIVSGTGLHTVEYQGSNGAHGTTIVPIDVTKPVVNMSATPGILEVGQTSNFGFFACADAGSGIATCSPSSIPNTTTPTPIGGTLPITVTATDRVGLPSDPVTGSYRVVYAFRGFFQPVDNLPVLNSVKAGNGVPVRFSLGGNQGLNIFKPGYPLSTRIKCAAEDPITDIELTVTAGSSSLSYDSGMGRYTYTWKTEKSWAGTCRALVMKFVDDTEHTATFKFK
jgi:Big-like domain-containing protein/peptidase C25-like protein